MKKIASSLLGIVSFLTMGIACGTDADHFFCTDTKGREFHVMKDNESVAFSGRGTRGLHGGILKKSKTDPHTFIGNLYSLKGYAVMGKAFLPQPDDLAVGGVSFTIIRMDEAPQTYSYTCRKVKFANA